MRTTTAALAAVALTIGLAAPAAAHPRTEISPPIGVDLTHESTDNVAFVARFHEHFGTAGGILTSNENHDNFFVVTDPRGVFTYDVSDPTAPDLLGFALVNQVVGADGIVKPLPSTQAALAQEDPSTDGRLVLVDGSTPESDGLGLQVVDISDPAAPTVIGALDGVTDHTWTCVTDPATDNGCAYAYGRSDQIIDLTDPTDPELVEEGWKTQLGDETYTHDLTEIRPGLVMSAGSEPVLMDTTDPAAPIELVRVDLGDHGAEFLGQRQWPGLGYHSVEWAQGGADDFLIMGTEIAPNNSLAGTDCDGPHSVIETWDTRPVRDAIAAYDALVADGASRPDAATTVFGADRDNVNFVRIDAYNAASDGIYLDGEATGHVLYCAHWMEPARDFENGGRLVVSHYNRGTRFVEVAPLGTIEDGTDVGGQMTEIGWFIGAESYSGSSQWISDDVVYVMDYRRGMEVIKLVEAEATGTYTGTGSVSDRAMTIAEMEDMGIAPPPAGDGVPYGLLVTAGLALVAAAALRRRHLATAGA